MSLSPGVRLGPYEILSAIGAGGMGEVYRAHDTNLRRQVATKILPEAFAQDPDPSIPIAASERRELRPLDLQALQRVGDRTVPYDCATRYLPPN